MAKLIGSGKRSKHGTSWTVYAGFLITFIILIVLFYRNIESIFGLLVITLISLVTAFLLFREDATTAYLWVRVQLRNKSQHPNFRDPKSIRALDIPNLRKILTEEDEVDDSLNTELHDYEEK